MKHLEEVIQEAIVHGQERYRRPYKKILIGTDTLDLRAGVNWVKYES